MGTWRTNEERSLMLGHREKWDQRPRFHLRSHWRQSRVNMDISRHVCMQCIVAPVHVGLGHLHTLTHARPQTAVSTQPSPRATKSPFSAPAWSTCWPQAKPHISFQHGANANARICSKVVASGLERGCSGLVCPRSESFCMTAPTF